jgi:hypothetical protein
VQDVGERHRFQAFGGDEVLDGNVGGVPDPDVVAAAVIVIGDPRPPSCPESSAPSRSAWVCEAASSRNTPTRQLPSLITGGVSRNRAKLRLPTSTPSMSPESTW